MKSLFVLFVTITLISCATSYRSDIKPFKINVPETVLEDLHNRLENTRWPDTLQDITPWEYGADLNYIKELTEYWKTKYDWRKQEELLNSMPQYITQIDGLDVHFVHARSVHSEAEPIILVHGWPGSFMECYKVLDMLVHPTKYGRPASDAFNLVCPSIPGYGFSSRPTKKGFNTKATAKIFIKLMAKLGYTSYFAQGGDWGSMVTTHMASLDSEHIKGLHLNMIVTQPWAHGTLAVIRGILTHLAPSWMLSAEDYKLWQRNPPSLAKLLSQSGYMHIQATKPQTVSYALNDSPVGLAAYIVEKFHGWSDCGGDIEFSFTKDELLTNVMIYWVTQTIGSSVRYYLENLNPPNFYYDYVKAPVAAAVFKDLQSPVRAWADWTFNIQRWTVFESGGHFPALEEPKLLVQDICDFRNDIKKQPKSEL